MLRYLDCVICIPLPLVECLSDVRNINPIVLYYEIVENNHNINHILSQMFTHKRV